LSDSIGIGAGEREMPSVDGGTTDVPVDGERTPAAKRGDATEVPPPAVPDIDYWPGGVATDTSDERPGGVTTGGERPGGAATGTSGERPGGVTTGGERPGGAATGTSGEQPSGVVTDTSDERTGGVAIEASERPGGEAPGPGAILPALPSGDAPPPRQLGAGAGGPPRGPRGRLRRRGGKGPRRPRSRRSRYLRRAILALIVLFALPIISFVIVYLMTPVPSSTQPTAQAEQSVFFYNDGKSIIARTGDFDRRPVPLSNVPQQVRDAVISAENRSFYSDPGVSLRGSGRAVWETLSGGSLQGGSTITQQMVRNYYSGLGQQRTATRKLKEIMIALKVGREKDKDWILEQYLNTIYYGRDAYGVEAAAQAYYTKDVAALTPAEGAYLAAAIQVPTYAGDPVGGARSYMEARWRYVVDGMVRMKTISPQQAATMTFPLPKQQKQKSIFGGNRGYMVHQAKVELRRMGYTDNQINMGGLKVTTTFDKDLMVSAQQAVENNLPPGTPKKVMAGLVSVNPSNGEVNAFYGGHDYIERQFNSAFDAKVQAGSGFKPYVLAAALDDGTSLTDYFNGRSPQTFAGKSIHNDRNENFGEVNLITATQESINTAYVNLGKHVGLDKVIKAAEKAGIPAAQLDPHKDAPTLPLGVADVSVVQQAAGYATFASEGMYHAPHVVRSVTDHSGKERVIATDGERAFPPAVARDATYAMQKVVDQGTGINAGLPDRNAAGKTGTTSNGKQIWFNGFIPQLATSVGIFRSDNKPLNIPGYSAYGGDLPARMWRSYVMEADRRYSVKAFGPPSVFVGPVNPRPTFDPTEPRPHPSDTPTEPEPPTTPPDDPPTGPPTRPPTRTPDPPPTDGPQGGRAELGATG
jgi:membrane peptidoglycan carboxypeptidase